VSTTSEALEALENKYFDFVITMPRFDETDATVFGLQIKERYPKLPVFLLTHNSASLLVHRKYSLRGTFDRTLVWSGNADLLLALIKNVEDRWNIAADTRHAKVRVIILVEDSPYYRSSFLPLLYKEIVSQTQAVMEESLNDEHRLLKMRARPKILVADNFEEAMELYHRYKPYVLTVLSDVRYPKDGVLTADAGFVLMSKIRAENPDLPLLLMSSEESNRSKAKKIPAVFLNKNNPALHDEIRQFFKSYLGFGDFVFRMPSGREVARGTNMRSMEEILPSVPDESVEYHAHRNDFSTWLMARTEIPLSFRLRPRKVSDFNSIQDMKNYLVSCFHTRRRGRQIGIVTEFDSTGYDPDADFIKIGKGSLGGKARGLAYVASLLKTAGTLPERYPTVDVSIPKTLVIATDGFDAFITANKLHWMVDNDLPDDEIRRTFEQSEFPDWLARDLEAYLVHAKYPLAVRSSSLLEDAYFQPFAGIYQTYMIPNIDPDPATRLERVIRAIKLVYASTYLANARSYAGSTLHRIEEEKMAVVIHQLVGRRYDDIFYPAISGVAQSYNFYPIGHLKSEDGIAHIALGLGKTVVEGGKVLRFSPNYPQFLPQFSTVDDILQNAQRFFYALNVNRLPAEFDLQNDGTLTRLEIDDVESHPPIRQLSSTYSHQDHRIRDGIWPGGYPVLTFAHVLKHNLIPLPELLSEILDMGRRGLGSPVEVEFAVNLADREDGKVQFSLLQIRPMAWDPIEDDVVVGKKDRENALLYSQNALGISKLRQIDDIVYVKPQAFDPGRTVEMVSEIRGINAGLLNAKRKYLLVGPGRWGSADRWLGIPVNWRDISGVCAIVEATAENLNADPSQGSHFFHNLTSLGISYITLSRGNDDFIEWEQLDALPAENETEHIRHVRLDPPLTMKIDGKNSRAVLLKKGNKEISDPV
jgi:CheY-like chemotaxis protein